jgi:hypothetical protein
VHFENTQCLVCGRRLGFLPDVGVLTALDVAGDGRWRALAPEATGGYYRMCNNYVYERVCNWVVHSEDEQVFCLACRLNEVIPNLDDAKNRVHWQRIERAKRRLLYTLYLLGLPVVGRDRDPERGLAFQFLESAPPGAEFADGFGHHHVITGHRHGLITINVAEADPSAREEMRERMQEQYRTLLGHFRHEIGHYYWQLLIAPGAWLERFRGLFGDERSDYDAALQRHYGQGAPADWQQGYISAYASAHPWEDWAETWAHYLHMVDALETAEDLGFAVGGHAVRAFSLGRDAGTQRAAAVYPPVSEFDALLGDWIQLTIALNALNRSMGQPDAYPFALSARAGEKLRFVHDVVADYRKTAVGA